MAAFLIMILDFADRLLYNKIYKTGYCNERSVKKMKYITFVVPSYNSQDYLERCVNTLMPENEDVEIIIVNDGSTDKTAEIADRYHKKYPNTVQVIHKENGGHGSALNTGLKAAQGIYFKCVDSDDWLDTALLKKLLDQIKQWDSSHTRVDLIICNYIYDHLYENKKKVISYNNVFKKNEIMTWEDIGHFLPSQYILMHATFFRTDILKKSGVVLPEHTFYVDNIFAHQPLSFTSTICYLDLDMYHYFIGRADQSVNEKVMMKRIDQQIRVTKIIMERVMTERERQAPKKLRKYLVRNLSIMLTISDIHLLMINDAEAYSKRKELWDTVKERDYKMYRYLKHRTMSGATYLPGGKVGGCITVIMYKMVRPFYKFN